MILPVLFVAAPISQIRAKTLESPVDIALRRTVQSYGASSVRLSITSRYMVHARTLQLQHDLAGAVTTLCNHSLRVPLGLSQRCLPDRAIIRFLQHSLDKISTPQDSFICRFPLTPAPLPASRRPFPTSSPPSSSHQFRAPPQRLPFADITSVRHAAARELSRRDGNGDLCVGADEQSAGWAWRNSCGDC